MQGLQGEQGPEGPQGPQGEKGAVGIASIEKDDTLKTITFKNEAGEVVQTLDLSSWFTSAN